MDVSKPFCWEAGLLCGGVLPSWGTAFFSLRSEKL